MLNELKNQTSSDTLYLHNRFRCYEDWKTKHHLIHCICITDLDAIWIEKPNIIWYVVFDSHLEYDSEKKYNTNYVIMFFHFVQYSVSHIILYFRNIQQRQFYIEVQKPCKATYFCGHVISNLFCLVFPSNLQSITAVILHFSNKTGSIFSYLETHFAGNALIEPILIYVKDNTIRSRLNNVRQIPGNSSYLVFAPRASIIVCSMWSSMIWEAIYKKSYARYLS